MSGNNSQSEQRYLNAKRVADEMIKLASLASSKQQTESPSSGQDVKQTEIPHSSGKNSNNATDYDAAASNGRNNESSQLEQTVKSVPFIPQGPSMPGVYSYNQDQKQWVPQSTYSPQIAGVGGGYPQQQQQQRSRLQTPPQYLNPQAAPGQYVPHMQQPKSRPQTPSQYPAQTQGHYIKQEQANTGMNSQEDYNQTLLQQQQQIPVQTGSMQFEQQQQVPPGNQLNVGQNVLAGNQLVPGQNMLYHPGLNQYNPLQTGSVQFGLGSDDSDESIPSDYSDSDDEEMEAFLKMAAERATSIKESTGQNVISNNYNLSYENPTHEQSSSQHKSNNSSSSSSDMEQLLKEAAQKAASIKENTGRDLKPVIKQRSKSSSEYNEMEDVIKAAAEKASAIKGSKAKETTVHQSKMESTDLASLEMQQIVKLAAERAACISQNIDQNKKAATISPSTDQNKASRSQSKIHSKSQSKEKDSSVDMEQYLKLAAEKAAAIKESSMKAQAQQETKPLQSVGMGQEVDNQFNVPYGSENIRQSKEKVKKKGKKVKEQNPPEQDINELIKLAAQKAAAIRGNTVADEKMAESKMKVSGSAEHEMEQPLMEAAGKATYVQMEAAGKATYVQMEAAGKATYVQEKVSPGLAVQQSIKTKSNDSTSQDINEFVKLAAEKAAAIKESMIKAQNVHGTKSVDSNTTRVEQIQHHHTEPEKVVPSNPEIISTQHQGWQKEHESSSQDINQFVKLAAEKAAAIKESMMKAQNQQEKKVTSRSRSSSSEANTDAEQMSAESEHKAQGQLVQESIKENNSGNGEMEQFLKLAAEKAAAIKQSSIKAKQASKQKAIPVESETIDSVNMVNKNEYTENQNENNVDSSQDYYDSDSTSDSNLDDIDVFHSYVTNSLVEDENSDSTNVKNDSKHVEDSTTLEKSLANNEMHKGKDKIKHSSTTEPKKDDTVVISSDTSVDASKNDSIDSTVMEENDCQVTSTVAGDRNDEDDSQSDDDINDALADERPPSDDEGDEDGSDDNIDDDYVEDSESDSESEVVEEIPDSEDSDVDDAEEVSSDSDSELKEDGEESEMEVQEIDGDEAESEQEIEEVDGDKTSQGVDEQVQDGQIDGEKTTEGNDTEDDTELEKGTLGEKGVEEKSEKVEDEANKVEKSVVAEGTDKNHTEVVKKKRKRKTKTKESGEKEAKIKKTAKSNKDGTKQKGKKTRKRKKKGDSADGENSPKKRKKSFERKNIRQIMEETELDEETVKAQQEEIERKQRLLEKMERLKQAQLEQEKAERLKQSQLQSLLEDDDDDYGDIIEEPQQQKQSVIIPTPVIEKSRSREADVVEISSDEDEISVVPHDSQQPEEELDPNNSGSHVNDAMNQPDASGRVLVNVGHPPDEPDIFLAPQLSASVKPHQIGGIRFLYDNLVESLEQYKNSNGLGCILAHSMGLGKTLQVICFTDVVLRYTEGKRVMIIVPVNTLQNWIAEYNMWLPKKEKVEPSSGVWPREFTLYVVNDSNKTTASRSKVVEEWYKNGGCLLMGYEMYRLLTSKKIGSRAKKPKNNEPVMIDLVEEEKNTELLSSLRTALVNPGPDLVICDEGHRIKNSHAGISQSLKNIRTRRRVVLTGYPLQNNLLEYWCMVDFVRPNFLGTRTEFANMFERPIMNGQCVDSTPQDHRLMRFRAHVLHSLLEGFVQRRSHDVLTRSLPQKIEHVILVRMSPIQRILYRGFMDDLQNLDMSGWANNNPLKAFSVCCKIWNHPDILNQIVEQRKLEDNDLDIEDSKVDDTTGKPGRKGGGRGKASSSDLKKVSSSSSMLQEGGFNPYERQTAISYDWAHDLLKGYRPGIVENSGKLVLLISILEQSLSVGDKLLLFSQSLFTLSLIEEYLSKLKLPNSDEFWAKNKNYFRLDGSTAGQDREKMINQFNSPDNKKIHLFLLSTRAGCLGINLIGANRVLVFDASWNPCHDAQAVCRVYRYGQMKKCHVYRLVSDLTMEKKIYDRQINKQGMSDRVVDELNPTNVLTRKQVDVLLEYEDKDLPDIEPEISEKFLYLDSVLYNTVKTYHKWLTKDPFTHESLLIDRKDQKLTQMEKRLARQGYEMEKKMSISYSRPSYAAFYPKGAGGGGTPQGNYPGGPPMIPNSMELPRLPPYRNRPVASVRPMISQPPMMTTPIPMQPLSAIRHLHESREMRKLAALSEGTELSFGGASSSSGGSGGTSASNQPSKVSNGPAILKPGVSVQQVKLQSDIPVPGSTTAEGGPQRIPSGETVLVIKTPKGVYIRTPQGKIFAVRSAPKGKDDDGSDNEVPSGLPQMKSDPTSQDHTGSGYMGLDDGSNSGSMGDLSGSNMASEVASLNDGQGQSFQSEAPASPRNSVPPAFEQNSQDGNLQDSMMMSSKTSSLFNRESSSDDDVSILSSRKGRKDRFLSSNNVQYPSGIPAAMPHVSSAPGGSGSNSNMFPFFAPEFSGPAAYQPWSPSGNPYMGSPYHQPFPTTTNPAGIRQGGWEYPVPMGTPPVAQQLVPSGIKQRNEQSNKQQPWGGGGMNNLPTYSSSSTNGKDLSSSGVGSPLTTTQAPLPPGISHSYSSPILSADTSLDTLVKDLGIDQYEDDSNSSSTFSDQKLIE